VPREQGETVSLPTVLSAMTSSAGSCLRFHRDGKVAVNMPAGGIGVGIAQEEAVAAILRWCAPMLFSLMDSMDVIRLLGAVLTENKVVAICGSLDVECVSAVVLALVCAWLKYCNSRLSSLRSSHRRSCVPL
jgi:hypothetical protein